MDASSPVVLHVYDISQGLARQLSASLLGKVIDAIYHTGIVVYGREYWFGGGIESGIPGQTYFGPPMQRIVLGHTEIPKEVFDEFLGDIRSNYTAATYSLLTHNCNNFSDEVAQFLVGKGIPANILNLPQEVLNSPQGALLVPMLQQLETSLRNRSVPQPPHFLGATSPAYNTTLSPYGQSAFATSSLPASTPAQPTQQTHNSSSRSSGGITAAAPPAPTPSSLLSASGSAQGSSNVAASADTATERERLAKQQLHAEISREFAAIMAGGGLDASAAAVAALQRVMARHAAATAATAGAGGAGGGNGNST